MKYFSFKEMIKSNTAKSKGLDNIPTWDEIDNLKKLIETILDPLREWYGKPIIVNSAFRSEAVNKAVKGVKTSLHLRGMAADITTNSKTNNRKLFDYMKDNLPFTEMGWEKDGAWIHVAWNGNDDKEIFYT